MQRELCARIAQTLAHAPVHDHLGYEALAHLKLPGPDYRVVLKLLHLALKPKTYVEIGVRAGDTLALAAPETRCIGIDPAPQVPKLPPNVLLSIMQSDDFFKIEAMQERAKGFDLALIDGDHSFDQALRDFLHLEALAGPHSIIAIHDVIPMDERTATPTCASGFWSGDVWRLMWAIRLARPDLVAFTIACPPTGLGIVGRFPGKPLGIDDDVIMRVRKTALDMDWDTLVERLNIVPNDGAAIVGALSAQR